MNSLIVQGGYSKLGYSPVDQMARPEGAAILMEKELELDWWRAASGGEAQKDGKANQGKIQRRHFARSDAALWHGERSDPTPGWI